MPIDSATQYTDALMEYRDAPANIDEHGIIVQHPRTIYPIENPYSVVRDRALRKLWAMAPRVPRALRGHLWEGG